MAHLIFGAVAVAAITVLSGSATADSAKGDTTRTGNGSTDAKQETFVYVGGLESPYRFAFIGPARNIGRITGDLEKDTFGYLARTASPHLLAFIGPARNIGPVTGDAEKDTIAYRPMVGTLTHEGQSFCLERE